MALRAVIAASLLVVAGLCRAQSVAYSAGELAADGSQALYRVSLTGGTASRLGYVRDGGGNPVSALGGMTFGLDTQLYAIGAPKGAQNPSLMTVATTLATATMVSTISGLSASASTGLSLSFSCDGHLWMASSDSKNFWELTPGTGQIRLVGNLGVKITALATSGNVLYGIGGSGNANLYTIATGTGVATKVGSYNASVSNPVDASFDSSGTLWGMIRNFDSANPSNLPSGLNALAQINPGTGAMTSAGTIANPSQTNLTYPAPLSGLAVAPPTCSVTQPSSPSPAGAPVLSPIGLGLLFIVMLVSGHLWLFRFRPN